MNSEIKRYISDNLFGSCRVEGSGEENYRIFCDSWGEENLVTKSGIKITEQHVIDFVQEENPMDYCQYFKTKLRTNGEPYVYCEHGTPEDVRELIYEIHKELYCGFPNDWIYKEIYEAFEALEEDTLEDITLRPDDFESDLTKWLGESFAPAMIAQAQEEVCNEAKDIWIIIGWGQWYAKDIIYRAVDLFLTNKRQ